MHAFAGVKIAESSVCFQDFCRIGPYFLLFDYQEQARIQDFLRGGGGGGVNDGRVQRAFGARADGGGVYRVDKHQIKVGLHSVHRIFRAICFLFFLL